MRDYELTLVLTPRTAEEGESAAKEKLEEYVVQRGGMVSEVDHWGKRKLAYPIRKFMEGDYILGRVQLDPDAIPELEATLELSDEVLRYLLIRTDN